MHRRLVHHTRRNVIAYLALFVALSGTAVAAKPLITGANVQDGSLTGADVQGDSLTGDNIDESTLGEVPNATSAGVRNRTIEFGLSVFGSDDFKEATADCPAGKVVVGGGSELTGETRGVKVRSSRPLPQATKWSVDASEDTEQTGEWAVTAFAICVDG